MAEDLYSFGVMPTAFLKTLVKCCGYWKPNSYATSEIDLSGSRIFSLLRLTILFWIYSWAVLPVSFFIRSPKYLEETLLTGLSCLSKDVVSLLQVYRYTPESYRNNEVFFSWHKFYIANIALYYTFYLCDLFNR